MKTSTLKKIVYSAITILLIIIAWEIVAFVKNEPTIFPHITGIFKSLINIFSSTNITILLMTFLRVVISIIISFVLSLLVGILYIYSKDTIYFFKPIISFMRSTPQVVLSIFLFILFDKIAPFLITILVIFPIATEGIITSIDNIDPVLKDDLKMIKGAFFKKIFYAYIPLIKDYLLMVFIQIFGLGFKVMIMGEYISYTKNSIGGYLYGIKGIDLPELIAWGILVTIIVIVIEYIVKFILKKIDIKNEKLKSTKIEEPNN